MSFLLSQYRPISITLVLFKFYVRWVYSRLCAIMETKGVFQRYQYAFRKGLGTWDALLDIVRAGQVVLDRGM